MKVLIIKTSSFGDIIHTFPALTDAGKQFPDIHFDWVVEEAFQEAPAWHPLVKRVIPIAWRRWRKTLLRSLWGEEFRNFLHALRQEHYELVLDAQGLIKSGLVTYLSHGLRVGLNKQSLTESLARLAYQKTTDVDLTKHAVFRMRSLFAQALDYFPHPNPLPQAGEGNLMSSVDFGISKKQFAKDIHVQQYIVFLHGTTWPTKHWPENYWVELAQLVEAAGYHLVIPWYGEKEHQRAQKIAKACTQAIVLPQMSLTEVGGVIAHANGVVAVDTGLGHLSAALNIPTVSLYGPTSPARTGTVGENQVQLVPAYDCVACDQRACRRSQKEQSMPRCFTALTPIQVFQTLQKLLVSMTVTA